MDFVYYLGKSVHLENFEPAYVWSWEWGRSDRQQRTGRSEVEIGMSLKLIQKSRS